LVEVTPTSLRLRKAILDPARQKLLDRQEKDAALAG